MTARLRVAIVDDEPPARSLLRDYLTEHPDVEVVAECADGFAAVKALDSVRPDLVLLDVQMPKLDGFEVLELLDPGPLVVFVTAFDEFALRAFEVNAVDYLLKPLGRERLAEALERVRERLRAERQDTMAADDGDSKARAMGSGFQKHEAAPVSERRPAAAGPEQAAQLAAARRGAGRFIDRILVKEGPHVHVIPVDRVDWMQAEDDYVSIHAGGKTFLKTQPLSTLTAGLDPARFVQVHRAFTLNVERIARIEVVAKDRRVAILRDGSEIPVSRSGYARLRDLVG
jgi:two-component system LytT family response regulator